MSIVSSLSHLALSLKFIIYFISYYLFNLFILQYINKTGFRVCFKELFKGKYDPVFISYTVLSGRRNIVLYEMQVMLIKAQNINRSFFNAVRIRLNKYMLLTKGE